MPRQDGAPKLEAAALESLLEVTRSLARPLELDAMLEIVIEAGRSVLRADRGTVFLYDADNEVLISQVATGSGELRVPADRGIVGECVRTRDVINVPDCYADTRFNRDVDKKTGYRTHCLMTIPLIGHDDSLEGVMQVLNKHDGVFTEQDEQIATALGAQCAVALQRVRLLKDHVVKERMEQEIEVARSIQMRVLPQTMPKIDGYDLFGWSKPAEETGGDIFDIIESKDGLILLLGDATGHGIGPALSVTQVRAMLRMCVLLGADIDTSTKQINGQLARDLSASRFVTAFLGALNRTGHRIAYHAAGQGPLLHYHAAEDRDEWLDSSTMPLGIFEDAPIGDSRSVDMAPGDLFIVATDGIFEYENPSEEQYGTERFAKMVRKHQKQPVEELVKALVVDVESFCGGTPQMDDMTILALRRKD